MEHKSAVIIYLNTIAATAKEWAMRLERNQDWPGEAENALGHIMDSTRRALAELMAGR